MSTLIKAKMSEVEPEDVGENVGRRKSSGSDTIGDSNTVDSQPPITATEKSEGSDGDEVGVAGREEGGVVGVDGSGEGDMLGDTDKDREGEGVDDGQGVTGAAVNSMAGYLPWDKDLEMISCYQERKDELSDSYRKYLLDNPELWALLADFLQALFIQRPENVFQFASGFFHPFEAGIPPPPSHPTTRSDPLPTTKSDPETVNF